MSSWMFDMLMILIAVPVLGFIFFKLTFSSTEALRREMAEQTKPRFDRREAERMERRKQKTAPPADHERRINARR